MHPGEAQLRTDLGLCPLGAEADRGQGALAVAQLRRVRLEGLDVLALLRLRAVREAGDSRFGNSAVLTHFAREQGQ
ncbi:hypothetical protein [Streptomyces sp. NPDC101393]|uniref:hypothetical protein n=1 Tax=Streptomyces sp. NPDC101393 TaxID=3366141 RepID=UPI0038221B76